ncbi:MAG: penicillin acylase family protein [Actinomycetes bacterium]
MSEHEVLDSDNAGRSGREPKRRLRRRAREGQAAFDRRASGGKRRKWLETLVVVVGVLALLAIVATVAAGWLVQRSFPQTTGEVSLPGLDGPVEVLRDDLGVPTIEATTSHDLFYAQGYVHAQDRFWEMDVRRHITSGRLSEMFGESQVDTDKFVRTLGWRTVAEKELEILSPETMDALQAYADGVNAYLAGRSPTEVSLEYAALAVSARDYQIEPWTPADSVSWLKAMAWDLRSNLEDETARALLSPKVGGRLSDLYPPYPYDKHDPILPRGAVVDGQWDPNAAMVSPLPNPGGLQGEQGAAPVIPDLLHGATNGAEQLDRWLGAYGPGVGSNSFAVTGARTASGGALLANDPHLAPSLPGIWYQMNLQCNHLDVRCPYNVGGFTFSGVPGVIIGHNDHIAWGFTNNGADVTDLAYEAINGNRYVRDGQFRSLKTHTETIEVAGGDPVDVTVRSTQWGPLLSDVGDLQKQMIEDAFDITSLPGQADEVAVALRWTALQPDRTADAILELNRASNFDQFRSAAVSFAVPSQNMIYADVDGHIGYQMPGKIPSRPPGNDGTMPVDGWNSSNDWLSYIPFSQLPWEFDPPEQYIVTANQAVVDAYPRVLTEDWGYGYRSQRLVDLIKASPPLTPESAAQLMTDTRNDFASVLIGELFDLDDFNEARLSPDTVRAREMLSNWDYHQDVDSPAAAYYNAVWKNVLRLTFEDELTGDLRPDGSDRWFQVMTRLFYDPLGDWWDDQRTDVVELRDQMLAQAMNDATDELTDRLGDDQSAWRWGDLHQLELRNPTLGESGIAPLEAIFNRGPFETAGGEGIVDATGWTAYRGYDVNWVPSMRMVVDLTDVDASRWVQLTGESGHVFSPHYTDQFAAWAAGDTYEWQFSADAVSATAEDTLSLRPADG